MKYSIVLFCPQAKDIQFRFMEVIQVLGHQKTFTFEKLESENFDISFLKKTPKKLKLINS